MRWLRRTGIWAAALALSFSAVYACTWSYPIWAIRSQTADPLFRFARNKKAGYIDATGKIVLRPGIAPFGNFGGEFHEGLLALRDGRYVDSSGKTKVRWSGGSARGFSEGLAPVGLGEYPAKWGFMDSSGRLAIPMVSPSTRA